MKEYELGNTSFYDLPKHAASEIGESRPQGNGPFDKPPGLSMSGTVNVQAGSTGLTALGQDVSATRTIPIPTVNPPDDPWWNGRYNAPEGSLSDYGSPKNI